MATLFTVPEFAIDFDHCWDISIPSVPQYTKKLICNHYVSRNYDDFIIAPIIELISTYFTMEMDDITIDDIKNAKNKKGFIIKDISINSYRFFLEAFPNGSSVGTQGKMIIFFYLISIPNDVSEIQTCYKLTFPQFVNENDINHFTVTRTRSFTQDTRICGNIFYEIKLDKIQNFNELKIKLEMKILSVLDKNGKEIQMKTKNDNKISPNSPICAYSWNIYDKRKMNEIRNAAVSDNFISPPFQVNGLKWYIHLYPNGASKEHEGSGELYLNLIAIPPDLQSICIKYKFMIKETNTRWTQIHCFHQDSLSWGWHMMIKTNDIQNAKELSIYIEMKILELTDKNGNTPKQYINKSYPNSAKCLELAPPAIYEWKISDNMMLNKIKNIKNSVVGIASPIFVAYGLKWYIKFWPCGSRYTRDGQVNIFLNLISLQSPTIRFVIKFVLSFIESDTSHIIHHIFKNNQLVAGETDWKLDTKDIQNLDEITIKVELTLIDVYEIDQVLTSKYVDHKNNKILPPVNIINLSSKCYEWRINADLLEKMKICPNGGGFDSDKFDMYSMKWFISCFPNGVNMDCNGSVNLTLCIILPDQVSIVSIRYILSIIETNTVFCNAVTFTKNNLSRSWGDDRLATNNLNNLKQCTIKLEMELVDVYYQNKNITQKFSSIHGNDQLKQNEPSITSK